jgi:hypothetical protein
MKQNKIPRNEYIRKPVGKTNPYKHDVDYVSAMGYRDDSPFNDRPYIDIHTPSGMIDMSNTGIPLMANGMYLPPYSGMYNMGTPYVREQKIPMAQDGQEFSDYQRSGPIASENPNDYLGWVGKTAEEKSFPIRKNNKQVPRFLNVSNNQEPVYGLPAATTYASGKEQNYMSPERRAYEQALANAQAKQQAENIKSAVDIAGLGFYPAAVAGSIMDVAEGDYSGAAMGLIPWLGKAGRHGKFWGQAYTKAINSGIPHKAAYPAKRFLKGLTAGTGSGLQAIDVYQDNPYGLIHKAYGGDPSLPNIEGHYPFGGIHTKTHTHMKEGGWLDQYQTRGEVKSYKPKSIEEYNFRKKMYDDSLSLANMSRKINWLFPENPNISKEEYERLKELENTYPRYLFAQEQYDIDQKKGETRDFKDYVTSYYLNPAGSSKAKSITGYDISEGEKKLDKKYEEASNKYKKSWVDKQGRYHDFNPDDLRGNAGMESIYDPQTGTTVDKFVDYKYPEANFTFGISNKYIKPTETLYKGSKNKKEHGRLSTSSKSTGWYDPNKPKPKFKNISNDEYITYDHEAESRDLFPFPKTRIVKPDPNTPQGEKMTMESYVNNINKALAVAPDYLPMIQAGMPELAFREPEIMASPTPRPSSTNNRISWRMDPETRKMVPVYLEGKTQKVKEGKRLYNKNIPSSTAAIPADFVPQFEPDGNKDVVSKQMGGWLDAYDDEYRRGGQRRRRGTSKNIQSSINDIFRRNYDVFGPAGKSRFNPRARYEEGGGLDQYQDAGQLRAASTTAAVPVSTQAPINPVNPESTMGMVDFVKHRWNTRDQGPSDWNLLMMDKTGSYVDSGVDPFSLMLTAPQQVIKTATNATKNLSLEKAAKKVLGDRAVNQIKTDVKIASDNVKETIKQYKEIKEYNKLYKQELKDLPSHYKQALQDLNTPEGVKRLKELGVDDMDDFMKFAEKISVKGNPLTKTSYKPAFTEAKQIDNPAININFKEFKDIKEKVPLINVKNAIDHELGHAITDYLRSKGKTYKGVNDLDIEAIEKLAPHVTSNITTMLNKIQNKVPKKSAIKNIIKNSDTEVPYYFFKGSKGEEPLAHLRETKRNMLDAGIIDNIHQTITPELLKMFRRATGRKDRMVSFLQNTPEAYKTLAGLLNKTPALIPIGLGVGAAANQKKMGGWLDKYNNF